MPIHFFECGSAGLFESEDFLASVACFSASIVTSTSAPSGLRACHSRLAGYFRRESLLVAAWDRKGDPKAEFVACT
jgi:hypothetical protein